MTESLRTLRLEFYVSSDKAERVSLLLNILALKGVRLFNFTLVSHQGLQVAIAPGQMGRRRYKETFPEVADIETM
ncbi:hypothetical protein ACOMHN_067080 [Nucella lapillus]